MPVLKTTWALKYTNGEGVPEDDSEAVKWYRKAAEQGNASAQFNLGIKYANGEGVPEDDSEAVKWYRRGRRAGTGRGSIQPRRHVRNGRRSAGG